MLIIGGGLSGFILALHCKDLQIPFEIIAPQDKNQSSQAAAGLFNPVVFKRMNLSWKAQELIPYLRSFYKKWETEFGSSFYHESDLLRPIIEADKDNFWKQRSKVETGRFTKTNTESPLECVLDSYSTGRVTDSGWVDTQEFLDASRAELSSNIVSNQKVQLGELIHSPTGVEFRKKDYHCAVFCEGFAAQQNPLWSYMPWKLAKGEVLDIKILATDLNQQLLDANGIISKEIFIIPLNDTTMRVGSNYQWEYTDSNPSDIGRNFVREKLRAVLGDIQYEVVNHKSGIRPTVADRRPFIGPHPRFENFYIFNGFGSKGVMLAPFFSRHLLSHIYRDMELLPEVNISRFAKRFKNRFEFPDVPLAWS